MPTKLLLHQCSLHQGAQLEAAPCFHTQSTYLQPHSSLQAAAARPHPFVAGAGYCLHLGLGTAGALRACIPAMLALCPLLNYRYGTWVLPFLRERKTMAFTMCFLNACSPGPQNAHNSWPQGCALTTAPTP